MQRTKWLALGAAAILFACGSPAAPITQAPAPPAPNPNLPVLRILITGPDTIAPGETQPYVATARMGDGSVQDYSQKVTWQSSNTTLLTVQSTGMSITATGVASGDTGLTATLPGDAKTGPVTARMNVLVIPHGTFRMTGRVREGDVPVVGATVTVIAGTGTGLTTQTDIGGQYRLYGVAGVVQVQASKSGYTPLTRTTTASDGVLVDFLDMTQAAAPPSVAGAYGLSITAPDGGCANTTEPLPIEYRHRSYTAVIVQDGTRLQVTLGGADFVVVEGRGNGFSGHIQPDRVVFQIAADYYYYSGFDVLERLSLDQSLTVFGDVTATLSPGGITGTLSGEIIVYAGTTHPAYRGGGGCSATFQFALTPQNAFARVRR